ncbi:MAG TPA: DUF3971 domain-containing protein [Phycisphaerae bacterium]|nr:DUF3971 domain-containing protein [Phycisphaerae bacterium]
MPVYSRGNPAHWWKTRSCGYTSRAPRSTFISPLRRLIGIGALVILILFLFGVWYATRPARVSRLAEALLSNVLGGSVSVQSGHLSLSGTLLLSNVQVNTVAGDPHDSTPLPIFSAEQIEARFDWVSLFAGELRATQLTAIRPTLYLVEDKQADRWNYEMLRKAGAKTKPSGAAGGPSRPVPLPVIVLRDARVQWGEFDNGSLKQTARAVIDGQFSPTPSDPFTYRFQLVQQPAPTNVILSPSGNAQVTVNGTWDMTNNRFTAAAQDIVLSDALRDVLPRQVREWWIEHHLRGKFFQLWVSYDNDIGAFIGADLDHVSMEMLATPRSDGKTYPVSLSDIRGSLRFGLSKSSIDVNIRGRLLGYNFEALGTVAGSAPDSPLDLHIHFPNALLGDEYPPIFVAFPGSQDLIQRVAPHGKFDLSLGIKRLAGSRDLHLDGNILCNDARMRFGPFPFPLDHVKGRVHFDENTVTFDNVTARADENLIHIQGATGTTPANKTIDFRVWGDDVVFDDRLAACLPGEFKSIWDQFVLVARGSFNCIVKRKPDREAPDIHVDLTLTDGFGYPKAFPYHFSHLHGQLVLTADQSFVNGISIACGNDGSGSIRLDGIIHHPGGNVRNLMPDLRATASVPIDSSLINAIPEQYTEKLHGFELAGRCGFDGIFQRKPAEDGTDSTFNVAGDIRLQHGLVRSHDGDIDLSDISAQAQLNGLHLELLSAGATLMHALDISATGAFELARPSAHLRIGAHGRDVVLPPQAPGMLPLSMRQMWNSYKPQGKIDIDANAVVSAGADSTPTTAPATAPASAPAPGGILPGLSIDAYSCLLVPKSMSLSHASWPASIDDIQGRLLFGPDKITFQQLTARSGPVALSCDGAYRTDTGECSLRASATSDGLPGPWTSKLPSSVVTFVTDHKTAGQFRLSLDRLERASADKPWDFDADLAVHNLSTDPSLGITADRLLLSTTGTWSAGGFDFTAQLNGTDVGFSGKTLDTLHAAVQMVSSQQTLNISDIDGKVAGGDVRGTVTVRFPSTPSTAPATFPVTSIAGQPGYEANLVLHDADLGRLALPRTATDEERKHIGDGRVSASLALQETYGTHPDRTGRGELVIQDGKIYNVPLAMGLMQLVTLRLPVEHAFDHAFMSYYLRDNKVTFEKILLESPSINLAGQGSMSLKDKALDLNFVTESPDKADMPLISPLINEIRTQLLELAVTGTIDNPKITPVPLSPLSAPLRALLPKKNSSAE